MPATLWRTLTNTSAANVTVGWDRESDRFLLSCCLSWVVGGFVRAELTGERGAVCAESLSPLINLNFATPPPRILRSSFSFSPFPRKLFINLSRRSTHVPCVIFLHSSFSWPRCFPQLFLNFDRTRYGQFEARVKRWRTKFRFEVGRDPIKILSSEVIFNRSGVSLNSSFLLRCRHFERFFSFPFFPPFSTLTNYRSARANANIFKPVFVNGILRPVKVTFLP